MALHHEEYLNDANQARAFLDYVDQRAGLLIGRPGASGRPDTYTFPHRTFQEYLAGCYLLTGSDGERVERFYRCAGEGDRWSLVARLGAKELLYNNRRNGARELFYLADELLEDEASLRGFSTIESWMSAGIGRGNTASG